MKAFAAIPSMRSAISRILFFLAGLSLISTLSLTAGEADGTYKIVRISSSFLYDGEPYSVPQREVKEALFGSDGIVIVDNKVPVYQASWFRNLKDPELREIIKTVEITGQRKVLLTPSDDGLLRGATNHPLVAKFSFNLLGSILHMNMRSHSRAKLDGKKLILNMSIRARAGDLDPDTEDIIITGTVRLVAERL